MEEGGRGRGEEEGRGREEEREEEEGEGGRKEGGEEEGRRRGEEEGREGGGVRWAHIAQVEGSRGEERGENHALFWDENVGGRTCFAMVVQPDKIHPSWMKVCLPHHTSHTPSPHTPPTNPSNQPQPTS